MSEPATASRSTSRPAPPPRSAILRARDLQKTYHLGKVQVPVLKGASLEVHRGEWLAILGASGSGKSTLLHLLGDLDRADPNDGEVQFDGRPLDSMSMGERNRYRNRSIGFVFQFYHLAPELTVLENTMLPALVRGTPLSWAIGGLAAGAGFGVGAVVALVLWFGLQWLVPDPLPPSTQPALLGGMLGLIVSLLVWPRLAVRFAHERAQRASALLESFGLGHRLRHRPRELSGGERQRVAIARALMNGPRVLLADEPTGNLDEKTGQEILELIAAQHAEGLTIVMVTHDPSIAQRADRVVELHGGRVAREP